MALRETQVSKLLDRKTAFFLGFETFDLIGIMFVFCLLNFIFKAAQSSLPFVWLPTLVLAGVLRWAKRGKPDNYLIHALKFALGHGTLSAFLDPAIQGAFGSKKGSRA